MNNIIYRHLDKLFPINKEEGYIDMRIVNCFDDVCLIFSIKEELINDWIYSHYPDKIYSIKWDDRICYYKENEYYRDNNLPVNVYTNIRGQEFLRPGVYTIEGDISSFINQVNRIMELMEGGVPTDEINNFQ